MAARALRQVRESDALAEAAAPPQTLAVSPIAHAKGALVRAPDGRDYVDFDNGGGSVLLGHADEDVEAAVAGEKRPAARLCGPLSERLIAAIPSVEDVRFYPAADDALNAACAAAKRATGRPRVLSCAQTPDGLVDGDVAAIVVDPLKVTSPCRRELASLRRLADTCGAVLVFDERRSALRVHEGGAQALYGVEPDLTVVGEALANGRPLAALGGRLEMMALVRGAPVAAQGLAAGLAVMAKLAREPVLANLGIRGAEVQALLAQRIRGCGAQELVSVGGDPTAVTMNFTAPAGRGVWLRALWAHGVWSLGEHYISYAHGDREIGRLLTACDAALEALAKAAQPSHRPPVRLAPALREVARR